MCFQVRRFVFSILQIDKGLLFFFSLELWFLKQMCELFYNALPIDQSINRSIDRSIDRSIKLIVDGQDEVTPND